MINRISLRIRLLGAAAIFLSIVLGIAGVGLVTLFERAITNLVHKELGANLDQLTSNVEFDDAGKLSIKSPFLDLRFVVPYGGKYWQISNANEIMSRSRSLWDTDIKLPQLPRSGDPDFEFKLPGPDGQTLLGLARTIIFETSESVTTKNNPANLTSREYVLITATNFDEINALKKTFAKDILIYTVGLAVFLLLAALAIVAIGLQPLNHLRTHVSRVVSGETARITGRLPKELDPLVEELNLLLKAQEDALKSARNRASDLAHGLKTPLSILTVESRALREKGLLDTADEINQQIGVMQKHIQRELARVRARGKRTRKHNGLDVSEAVHALVEVMKRLPGGNTLSWQVNLPSKNTSLVDELDFNEIAGNLLDNARKWANRHVVISGDQSENIINLSVEDDGPGVQDGQRKRLLDRGERLNPEMEGSGVGLSIVHDLVSLYDGSLDLTSSELGGLKVEVTLYLSPQKTS